VSCNKTFFCVHKRLCMCVCVCVCEREREREDLASCPESAMEQHKLWSNLTNITINTCAEAARSIFEPRNRLPWDVTVLFKPHIFFFFFTFCAGKSTFVLLTLLIPTLGFPLSNGFCRCAGIVLQNGCQVANRVADVCGESVILGITSEISRQRAGRKCVCVCVLW